VPADGYPYLSAVGVRAFLDAAHHALLTAAELIEQNMPHAVCPRCEGAGGDCKGCRKGCGYVTEFALAVTPVRATSMRWFIRPSSPCFRGAVLEDRAAVARAEAPAGGDRAGVGGTGRAQPRVEAEAAPPGVHRRAEP
jgi:hypothetical protein